MRLMCSSLLANFVVDLLRGWFVEVSAGIISKRSEVHSCNKKYAKQETHPHRISLELFDGVKLVEWIVGR